MSDFTLSRRNLIKALIALGLSASSASSLLHAATKTKITKPIPSSNEAIPVIGMGTSRTFDALGDEELLMQLKNVLQLFIDKQGTLIDSSPMYGGAEAVIGQLLKQVTKAQNIFAATKVWTYGKLSGVEQIEHSRQLWGVERFDLMQIHNLRDWQVHYETLAQMKQQGKIRYIGVTTSHGRYHDELESLLKKHPFDFVQLSYNIDNRDVEERLLPIALDKDIAVIVNRPFQRGDIFSAVRGKALPGFAKEMDIDSWGQYFLKFVISHPAVTCAIPATTKAKHLLDNMGAQFGQVPDSKMREEMIRYFKAL